VFRHCFDGFATRTAVGVDRWHHWTAVQFFDERPEVVLAGIGPDLVGAGANILYPIHDQFYAFNGKLELSTQRGLVQTFVDLGSQASDGGGAGVGSTAEVHISSGVDPTRGPEPADVDRVFPVVRSGTQLLLVVTSMVVVGGRLVERRAAS